MASQTDPQVIVMGEEITGTHHHSHHHDVVWGIILIFAGFIFLLNTLGLAPWSVWTQLWRVWPVFIILTGLRVVLGSHPVSRFVIAFITLTFFVMLVIFALYLAAPQILPPLPPGLQNFMQNWQTRDINEI